MFSQEDLWEFLRRIRTVSFESRSEAATGWDGVGQGTVVITEPSEGVLVFNEDGYWQPRGRNELHFTNVFRWSKLPQGLRLEHLRYGVERPVFLFDLAPGPNEEWHQANPHLCGEDCYTGRLILRNLQLTVFWEIHGPRKNEMIRYTYQ